MTPADLCPIVKKASPPSFECQPAPREGVLVKTLLPEPGWKCCGGLSRRERRSVCRYQPRRYSEVAGYGVGSRWSVRIRQTVPALTTYGDPWGYDLNCGRLELRCNDSLELDQGVHHASDQQLPRRVGRMVKDSIKRHDDAILPSSSRSKVRHIHMALAFDCRLCALRDRREGSVTCAWKCTELWAVLAYNLVAGMDHRSASFWATIRVSPFTNRSYP